MKANAVAIHQPDQLPVVQTEDSTLLAVISRAAADPKTDVEKMERLMAMYERIGAKRAETEFAAAFSTMQDKLPAIAERGDVPGRYTFAKWEDINAVIKPILTQHGFALSFRTDCVDGIAVTGVLSHSGGHSISTTIKLPADPSGNKPAVQAIASSVSYGKRYAAGALLNLTSHGEDDDAFAASQGSSGATQWIDRVNGCADLKALESLGEELASSSMQDAAKKTIRGAYIAKRKELQAAA
jgi:ERF superfamily